jgi:hypothetical protein
MRVDSIRDQGSSHRIIASFHVGTRYESRDTRAITKGHFVDHTTDGCDSKGFHCDRLQSAIGAADCLTAGRVSNEAIAWQAIFVADHEHWLIRVKQKIDIIGRSFELWWSRSVPPYTSNVSRTPLRSVSYSCGHLPKALASRAMTSTISCTTDFPLGSHPNNFLALIDSPNEVE